MNAERISEHQHTSAKTLKTETKYMQKKKEKERKKEKNRIAKHYEATTRSMTCVMRLPEREQKIKKNI